MPGYMVTVKGGVRTHVRAGKNVTVTGVGTHKDPYIISAQVVHETQDPVPVPLEGPAIEVMPVVAAQNPDGTVTLQGAFDIPGPLNPGESTVVMTLPDGYIPSIVGAYSVAADIGDDNTHMPVAARLVLVDDGMVAVTSPLVNEGMRLTIFLYSVTYWPVVEQ